MWEIVCLSIGSGFDSRFLVRVERVKFDYIDLDIGDISITISSGW